MPLTLQTHAQTLKEQTALQHQQAEDLIIPLLQKLEHFSQYQALLKMYLLFYGPVQASIRQWITPQILPDILERDHSGLLLQDLDINSAPHFNESLSFQNEGEALGALYVLEGSTLGGQVIAKMLRKSSFIPPHKFKFFEGYGASTGERWKKFIEVLNKQPEVSSLLRGATSAFDVFIVHIQKLALNDRIKQDQ